MTSLPVIAFTPVPLRRRADGWPPELQLRFIVALSQGHTPGDAALLVGKNRQNAYALRKRRGAESFAAAWDSVVAHVRRIRARERLSPPGPPAPALPFRRPRGAEAEAIAERGAKAVEQAPTQAGSRRALDEMLDALYGPKSDKGDSGEGGRKPPMGTRN